MNLSVNDAAEALQTAGAAEQRMSLMRRYSAFAPFMLLWGVIWLCGNVSTDISHELGRKVWPWGTLIGFLASIAIAVYNFRTGAYRPPEHAKPNRERAIRAAVTWFTLFAFFWASTHILSPLAPRQGNAFISMAVGFIYMIYGVWAGWRIFTVGLATVVAVLFGYFFLKEHYWLWMGVVSGGSLILGGLWLRKV